MVRKSHDQVNYIASSESIASHVWKNVHGVLEHFCVHQPPNIKVCHQAIIAAYKALHKLPILA